MNTNEVEIEYCVPCGLLPRAETTAHALLSAYGESLSGLRLVPGHGGVFRVGVDGHTVFDKASGDAFDLDTIQARVDQRLSVRPPIGRSET
jgi:selenoprotein W-related protein